MQKQKDSFSCPFVFANATSKFGPTQAREGLKGFAPAVTKKFATTDAQTEVRDIGTAFFNEADLFVTYEMRFVRERCLRYVKCLPAWAAPYIFQC